MTLWDLPVAGYWRINKHMSYLLRLLMVVSVTLGILAPRASAVVVEVMPGSFQMIVICAGSEMQTIVIDAQGNAVEIASADTHECVFKDSGVATRAPEGALWHTIERNARLVPVTAPHLLAPPPAVLPPPSQAPPLPT